MGLDLDPLQARGVQLRFGRRGATLVEAVGRMPLPVGSVADGRVLDPESLGAALAAWWESGPFATRSVIVGASSAQVRTTVIEQPELTADEISDTVRRSAPRLLGLSAPDHVVDYQVLERVDGPDGSVNLRVLVAAVPRHVVEPLLLALRRARLKPALVDLGAFAVLRGLVPARETAPGPGRADDAGGSGGVGGGSEPEPASPGDATGSPEALADDRPDPLEAAVAVGGGGSIVVTHSGGAPRALAVVGPGVESLVAPGRPADVEGWIEAASAAVAAHVGASGVDPARPLRLAAPELVGPRLRQRLAARTGRPVELGNPFRALEVTVTDADLGYRPELATATGLALAGRPTVAGAHRLDLRLDLAKERSVWAHGLAAGAVVAAVAAGLAVLWGQRADTREDVDDQADQAESQLAQLQTEISTLVVADELAGEVDRQADLVARSLQGDVAWSKLLQEVATVLPDDVWLRTFDGARSTDPSPGRFSVDGRGVDHTSSARWLLRMGSLPTVRNLWLADSSRPTDEQLGTLGEVRFQSSGELTDAALSDRVERYVPSDPRKLGIEPVPGPSGAASEPDGPTTTDPNGAEGEAADPNAAEGEAGPP